MLFVDIRKVIDSPPLRLCLLELSSQSVGIDRPRRTYAAFAHAVRSPRVTICQADVS